MKKRLIALMLCVTVFSTSNSFELLGKAEALATEVPMEQKVDQGLEPSLRTTNEYLQNHEYYEEQFLNLRKEVPEERTENSTTYEIEEGVFETEFYTDEVRYTDENGKLVDYDSSLVSRVNAQQTEEENVQNGYVYENVAGEGKYCIK